MSKRFTIDINLSVDLDLDEIWPDGDAPEEPTTEQVHKRFLSDGYGNVMRAAMEWGLDDSADVIVTECEHD